MSKIARLQTDSERLYNETLASIPPDSPRFKAAEFFLDHGLPHRRLENWKWTDVRTRLAHACPFRPASPPVVPPILSWAQRFFERRMSLKNRFLFVDGSLVLEAVPLPPGISLSTWDPVLREEFDIGESFLALNEAVCRRGWQFTVSPREKTLPWLALIFFNSSLTCETIPIRLHLNLQEGAHLKLLEIHAGYGNCVFLPQLTVDLGDGASLTRMKLQAGTDRMSHLSHVEGTLGKEAQWQDFSLSIGGNLSRSSMNVNFLGEGSSFHFRGGTLLNESQLGDTTLTIDHRVGGCTSRELFKAVVDDHAHGVFQAKVKVRPGAQKTDGKQSSHGLLLGETAEFDTKPELEIFADDVACGHGATVQNLNADHLFYLNARGIDPELAESMLIEAFIREVFEDPSIEGDISSLVGDFCERWLRGRRERHAI